MTINIAGHMARKKVVKNLNGDIIDLMDEENGGWIIKKGQIVNQEAFEDMKKKEQDKIEAAKAQAEAVVRPDAPDRTINPSKQAELEKRVDDMDDKLDKILQALGNKDEQSND